MPRTLAQLSAIVTHALHGDAPATGVSATEIVNEAGERLCAARPWNWLLRPPVTLSLTQDQSYVGLPGDLQSVEALSMESANGLGIVPTDLAEIIRLRGGLDGAAFGLTFAAVAHPGQAAVTAAPGPPRLEVWPTPAADAVDAIRLVYRAGWTALAQGTDAANVPGWIEPLLIEYVRAVAEGTEDGTLETRLSGLPASPTFASAVRRDGGIVNLARRLRNGHLRRTVWDNTPTSAAIL